MKQLNAPTITPLNHESIHAMGRVVWRNSEALFSYPGVTFEFTTESNYSWTHEEWSIPLIFTINKLTQIGDQMIIYGGGLRYWADGTEDDPEGLSVTFSLYFLFPN